MKSPEEELAEWDELTKLSEANRARYDALAKQGARIDGMDTHYLICLMETLLRLARGPEGPIDVLTPAKLEHERWVKGQLEDAERSVASVMEARAKHEEQMRQEAIRRGQVPPPPGAPPAPTVKNAALLHSLAARGDPKPERK